MKTIGVLVIIIGLFGHSGCTVYYERIHVLLEDSPVSGSEVFLNGEYIGMTNNEGYIQVASLVPGDTVTSRLKQYEHQSPRSSRWGMRVYITNVEVKNNGDCVPDYLGKGENETGSSGIGNKVVLTNHYVHLKKENTLIGFKIYVNAEWDMSEDEMIGYSNRFKEASEYFFNASDGQFFFEEVDVFDHNTKYGDSEYTLFADHSTWPHSTFGGLLGTGIENIFLNYTIQLPRNVVGNYGTRPSTFIHELGHLGFRLNDEYLIGTRSNLCTATGTMGDKDACLMNNEASRPKFCSSHPDNPHVGDLIYQNGDCWDAILDMYNDYFTSTRDKWELKSPETRGEIVGQIKNIPGEWTTKVTNHNIRSEDVHAGWHLVERFDMHFAYQDGSPASGQNVALWSAINPPGNTMGGVINIGPTNSNGKITIDGAHVGDLVMVGGNSFGLAVVQTTE